MLRKWIMIIIMGILMTEVSVAGWGDEEWGCDDGWGLCEPVPSGTTTTTTGGGGGTRIIIGITNETIRRYDVIVEVDKSVYKFNETIEITITIDNKGDIPDEDTELIYGLSNPINEKFRETKEQLFEVPIGVTILERIIVLPEEGLEGEWKVNVQYETEFQDTINVFKSFTVKKEPTFFDKLKNIKNPFENVPFIAVVALIIIVIYSIWKEDFKERKRRGDFDDRTLLEKLKREK